MGPKLHHHLPQSYQSGFCRDGRLWVYDRASDTFRRDSPRNVAAITHDYTIHRSDGTKDTFVEAALARIDGAGAPLTAKLRERVRLTADERQTYAWYIAFFAARVPRFRRWIDEHETARRKLFDREHLRSPEQLQHLIDNSDLTGAERAQADAELMFDMLTSEEYTVSLDQNSKVKAMVEEAIELMPRIHDLFWIVAHAVEGSQFITSDNPVVDTAEGQLATFAVAADTALMMMPTSRDRVFNFDRETPADVVHATNVETAKEAERLVLGRDEAYLRKVVEEAGIAGKRPEALIDIGPAPKR